MRRGFYRAPDAEYPESMDPSSYLACRRPLIASRMHEILQTSRTRLASVSPEAPDLFDRLSEYASGGKMLRGALACLGFELYAPGASASRDFAAALDLAAAMEALQSGLLIHDDIMDGDETRRGKPTLHKAYADEALLAWNKATADTEETDPGRKKADAPQKAEALGKALGICAADVCYFIAWDIISILPASVSGLCAKELVKVCLAQMRDVRWGQSDTIPSAEAVLDMYRHKTARYTFSLPLVAGALLAGRPDAADALEGYGEAAGIVFQLRDDSLGLFGDSDTIGKPVGSDIREGKKTLHHVLLRAAASPEESARLAAIYGNPSIGSTEIDYVRALTTQHGVTARVDEIEALYTDKAFKYLDALGLTKPAPDPLLVDLLRQFADFASSRGK